MDLAKLEIRINYLKNKQVENLILVNDSIIGPFEDIKKLIDGMKQKSLTLGDNISRYKRRISYSELFFIFLQINVFTALLKVSFKVLKNKSQKQIWLKNMKLDLHKV